MLISKANSNTAFLYYTEWCNKPSLMCEIVLLYDDSDILYI